MNALTRPARLLVRAALLAALLLPTRPEAVEVSLVASAFNQTTPDGFVHRMWGFALDAPGALPAAPGPVLTVPAGDTTLTVHLRNDLTVPISFVIPALPAALSPERITDSQGRARVTSFTATTAPGAVGTYTFTGVRPGTFLYHSGTNPAVQVQMGLFGAVRVESGAGEAYPGVAYDAEAVLVVSELDPALHVAVRDGTYGTAAYPTAVRYSPRWFLVNGAAAPAIPAIAATQGERVLLRLVNAGFEAHVPQLLGAPMTLVAEDGHPLPWPRVEDSAYLPAGRTVDAIVTAPSAGSYPLYDRRLFVSNPRLGAGGIATALAVSAPAGAPTSVDDGFAATEDVPLSVPAPGVLANDVGAGLTAELVAPPGSGTLALAADGSFTYAPPPDANGPVTFTYRARSGTVAGNVATAAIDIAPVNDVPIANGDAATVEAGSSVSVPVIANDADVDGDELFVQSVTPPANGAVAVETGGKAVTYTPNVGFAGADAFSYVATDGLAASAPAAVAVTVTPRVNQAPIATNDYATTVRNRAVTIAVLANDRDPDGTLVPGSVVTTAPTRGGTLVVNADGTVRYTPRNNFRGTDTFTYSVADAEGARSNLATVRVNVR